MAEYSAHVPKVKGLSLAIPTGAEKEKRPKISLRGMIDGYINPGYNLLRFLRSFSCFSKEKNLQTFYWDRNLANSSHRLLLHLELFVNCSN